MVSPQKEDGYTAIANELMEALARYRIAGEQMQCLLVIIRKTYGFNKKEDMISNSQFVKATGLAKGNVSRALKSLVSKRLVIKSDNKRIPTYRFNKNYTRWKLLSKKQPVIKSDNAELSKVRDTKDTITKDNIASEFKYRKSVPIPKHIYLTERMRAYVAKQGCPNGNYADEVFENFRLYYGKKGTKFQDWTLNFYSWVRKDKKTYNPSKYVAHHQPDTAWREKLDGFKNENQPAD